MRRLVILILFVYNIFFSFAQKDIGKLEIGSGMPEFTIIYNDGNKLVFHPYLNKVILINFFKTDCELCQQELKSFEDVIWPAVKDLSDFTLLVIGVECTEDELRIYKENNNLSFPLYPDPVGEIFSIFALGEDVPQTYLVDKANKIVFLSKGYTSSTLYDLQKAIHSTLHAEPMFDDPLQQDQPQPQILEFGF